eukprot:3804489-Prymnesium_polylepis.2
MGGRNHPSDCAKAANARIARCSSWVICAHPPQTPVSAHARFRELPASRRAVPCASVAPAHETGRAREGRDGIISHQSVGTRTGTKLLRAMMCRYVCSTLAHLHSDLLERGLGGLLLLARAETAKGPLVGLQVRIHAIPLASQPRQFRRGRGQQRWRSVCCAIVGGFRQHGPHGERLVAA